jgi:excisionase family DNA binding protein
MLDGISPERLERCIREAFRHSTSDKCHYVRSYLENDGDGPEGKLDAAMLYCMVRMAEMKPRKPRSKSTSTRPEFLTVREVMAILRLSRCATYKALESGAIPSMRIGKLYRIPAAWLELEAGRERG